MAPFFAALHDLVLDFIASPPPPLLLLVLGPLILPLILLELWRRTHAGAAPASALCAAVDPILVLPATELSARIRRRELTSRALTKACIDQLRRVDSRVNALTAGRFEEALSEADAADAAVASGRAPSAETAPLWGVPCVIKECFEVPGLPYTAGIVSRAGRVGVAAAPAVARLQAAGMPVLGSTNVSEACMFHEAANPIYGRTANPHGGGARTPGGSSGGAAALVACAAAPLAVTSDVGGSTRIPALYCGLFGHKPTGGTVPNTRTLPHVAADSRVSEYCQLGPTTRHAKDLFPLLTTLAGPDGVDRMCRADVRAALLAAPPTSVDVAGLTVFTFDEPFLPWPLRSRLHPELRQAQARAADALAARGCRVVRIGRAELPETLVAFSIWAAILGSAQAMPFRHIISEGRHEGLYSVGTVLVEAVRCLLRGGQTERHTLPALGLALVEVLDDCFPSARAAMVRKGQTLRARLDGMLGSGRAVMLALSLLTPAPRHYENLLRFTDAGQTGLFNVMALPATAVPLGADPRTGLPLGCQVIGGFGCDHVSLAVAEELERLGVAQAVPIK